MFNLFYLKYDPRGLTVFYLSVFIKQAKTVALPMILVYGVSMLPLCNILLLGLVSRPNPWLSYTINVGGWC